MTTKIKLLAPAFAVAVSGLALGQGADECVNADDLGPGTTSAPFDTGNCSDTMTLATTSAQNQCATLSEDVWFKWTATATGTAIFSTCNNATFDTEIAVWQGSDCSTMVWIDCNDDFSGCALLTSQLTVPTVAGQQYYFQVGHFSAGGGTWGTGTVSVTETNVAANDTCASPINIPAPAATAFSTLGATTSGFNGGGSCAAGADTINQDIFYTFTIPTAGDWTFDTIGTLFDTKLSVHSGTDCAATCIGYNDDASGLQSIVNIFGAMAGDQVLIQVGGFGVASGTGTLTVGPFVDPCPDDMFEDNDDCNTARPLPDGFYAMLNVEEIDNDFFAVGVDPGATLAVDIFFIDVIADIDLYLWDPAIACDTNLVGTGLNVGALEVGYSASDDEFIVYTNTTGVAQNLIIEVDMFTAGGCNDYDMQISGSNGMGSAGPGTNYCMANTNSTGLTASISAAGSSVASHNNVTLTTSDLPNNSFGFFLVSTSQGFVPNPGGSSGNLCLGGAIGRYVGPGQIQNSGQTGEVSLQLDLTMVPQPPGAVSIIAGDTFNWTTWYRDAVGGVATSNFSDGLSILFL